MPTLLTQLGLEVRYHRLPVFKRRDVEIGGLLAIAAATRVSGPPIDHRATGDFLSTAAISTGKQSDSGHWRR